MNEEFQGFPVAIQGASRSMYPVSDSMGLIEGKTEEIVVKNLGGRPTEYRDSMVEAVEQYLDDCNDQKYTLIKTDGVKSTTYENKIKVNLPTIEGLALYLDVNKSTIYEWYKIYPRFSDVIDKLREKQASELIRNGLSGDYNPVIAKVLLSKHGYKEGIETDHTSKGEKLTTPGDIDLDKMAEEIEKKLRAKKI